MSVDPKNQVPNLTLKRRSFVAASTAAAVALASTCEKTSLAQEGIEHTTEPRKLLKTLKIGMIRAKGDLTTKFKVAKEAGFDGVELSAPGINVEEARKAAEETGLVIDGSVGATHWKTTHSNSKAEVRAQALKDLEDAIVQTHAVGGHTVLLVVGHGKDGTEQEVWDRSIENISKALPLCGELGMTIAIENVWNHFCYQHDGPNDQSAEKFAKYVDEFNSPWVGMQFDIGNHWKYGDPAQWIRELGRRIVKFDIKGFDRGASKWADITEDDLPWADVRKAIDDIGFYGWIAAEVGGGDQARLEKVANQIDLALNIKTT